MKTIKKKPGQEEYVALVDCPIATKVYGAGETMFLYPQQAKYKTAPNGNQLMLKSEYDATAAKKKAPAKVTE